MIKVKRLPPVSLFIGLPGSGKTTIAAALVRQCLKKKITVYSNVPILGALKIDKSDIGQYQLDDCLIIIDEAGLEFDNRDFDKNFKGAAGKAMLEYFKLIRHQHDPANLRPVIKGARLCVFSQTVDIDLKIRSLAGLIYVVKPSLIPYCTVMHRVRRSIGPDENGHTLVDRLDYPTPFFRLFSSRLFRPIYYRYFDSYERPVLPVKDWEPWACVSRH